MSHLHLKTEAELNAIIFEGAASSEFRSPLDAFDYDQLCEILNHPAWDQFSKQFQDFIWQAVEEAEWEATAESANR